MHNNECPASHFVVVADFSHITRREKGSVCIYLVAQVTQVRVHTEKFVEIIGHSLECVIQYF